MATRRVKCEGSLFMESVFAKMQEIYTHVTHEALVKNRDQLENL